MSNKETTLPARWYKVLFEGKSFIHPTNYAWSLPVLVEGSRAKFIPGDWHQVSGEVKVCHYGLHLTSEPAQWMAKGATVYLAEFDDPEALLPEYASDRRREDKIAVRKARLIRPVTKKELVELQIFLSGTGEVRRGVAYAEGRASVDASGDAEVRAFGNARISAWGNAHIYASDNVKVEAWGNAHIEANDNADVSVESWTSVNAYRNARVHAMGNARVYAGNNASISAGGHARIEAWEMAQVRAEGAATVKIYGGASLIASDDVCVIAYGQAKVQASGAAVVHAKGYAEVSASELATVISSDSHIIPVKLDIGSPAAIWIRQRTRMVPPNIVVGGVEYAPVSAPAIEK